tara:strand:+ start:203 stop:1156 length:954 start_codon:yes stop_codon:yes gene_type:complete
VLTDNSYYTSGELRFRFFSNLDKIPTTDPIKERVKSITDVPNADGFLISETLDGVLLTVVAFSNEFFPYKDAISFHSLIRSKQGSISLGPTAIIKSLLLICKITGMLKLISRHEPKDIKTLFVLLDTGFKVSELSNHSKRYVLIERKFDKELLINFNLYSNFIIQDIYTNSSLFKPVGSKNGRRAILADTDIKHLANWLDTSSDMVFTELKEIEQLLQKQKYIRSIKLEFGIEVIFLVQNIETTSGLILCPGNPNSRKTFLKLYKVLKEGNLIKTYYTSTYNDFIKAAFFLSGYTNAGIVEPSNSCYLYKWEKTDAD